MSFAVQAGMSHEVMMMSLSSQWHQHVKCHSISVKLKVVSSPHSTLRQRGCLVALRRNSVFVQIDFIWNFRLPMKLQKIQFSLTTRDEKLALATLGHVTC